MSQRDIPTACFFILLAVCGQVVFADSESQTEYIEGHFSKDIVKRAEIDFRVYLPEAYQKTTEPWPLLLWLHGDGGQPSRKGWQEILSYGPPSMAQNGRDFPFVLVVPQLWGEVHWDPDSLHALLQESIREYNIDPGRVYLMGYSRGGFGSWELATSFPATFAAVVPISARAMTEVGRVSEMGVWIFHGELDTGVPLSGAQSMYQELKGMDVDVRLTVFPGVAHNAVDPAMETQQLWEWLLTQRR